MVGDEDAQELVVRVDVRGRRYLGK